MLRKTIFRSRSLRDSLNRGSSMTGGSKGEIRFTDSHRVRMPWVVAREHVATAVLNTKDKMILDGKQLVAEEDIDRMSQVDPLEVLRSAVATYEYNTSTGKNLFQLASQMPFDGRGQRFYRTEWQEGTYEKHITLSHVEFYREGSKGVAYGYVTFHGESTLKPMEIDLANVPGWHAVFDEKKAVSFDNVVTPPPSIGTEVPVDPKSYQLKSYPYYDAPNPKAFVERLLKDRGVLLDPPVDPNAATPTEGEDLGDGSVHKGAPA